MRFHVVSLPHTQTTAEFVHCAYTTKVVRFAEMMHARGHDVFLYSSDDNDAVCTEHIPVISKSFQNQFFLDDHHQKFFPIEWDSSLPYWQHMNSNVVDEVSRRVKPGDFLCLIAGVCQQPIADSLPGVTAVEFGVGYEGIFANHCVFESYAWMHYVYGRRGIDNGRYFDAVVPNYYNPDDFPLCEAKDDYLLYIGRLTKRKGLDAINDLCKQTGKHLVVIGQGGRVEGNRLVADHSILDCDFEYLGVVTNPVRKAELIGRAQAVLVPTQYVGPFEGVHIEAALCGTPVITTDWGVFTETVIHGVTGFRTRTLGEMIWAVDNTHTLNPATIRNYAVANHSLERVSDLYQAFFEQLSTLSETGWYDGSHTGITRYDRYTRNRPENPQIHEST